MESYKELKIIESFNELKITDEALKKLDKFILKNPGITFEECALQFKLDCKNSQKSFNVSQLKFLLNQINENKNTYYGLIGPFKIEDNKIFKKLDLKNPDDRSRLYHLISENSKLNKKINKLEERLKNIYKYSDHRHIHECPNNRLQKEIKQEERYKQFTYMNHDIMTSNWLNNSL